jgi:cytidylate kinase
VLKEGIPLDDEAAISLFLTSLDIQCELEDGHTVILLNGSDPDLHLRDPEVNHSVSKVSSSPEVRRVLTEILRGLVDGGSLVMEGRDIGSVVFPDTPYKFYIDASEEVRASRRAAQGETDSIARRDALDSTRKNAPLIISEDAHVVDSSHLTLEGVVGEIIGRLRMKGLHVTL